MLIVPLFASTRVTVLFFRFVNLKSTLIFVPLLMIGLCGSKVHVALGYFLFNTLSTWSSKTLASDFVQDILSLLDLSFVALHASRTSSATTTSLVKSSSAYQRRFFSFSIFHSWFENEVACPHEAYSHLPVYLAFLHLVVSLLYHVVLHIGLLSRLQICSWLLIKYSSHRNRDYVACRGVIGGFSHHHPLYFAPVAVFSSLAYGECSFARRELLL